MKKKYILEVEFTSAYYKKMTFTIFSEEFHPYANMKDAPWIGEYSFTKDLKVRVVKEIWAGCITGTTDEARMSAKYMVPPKKIEEMYYETYKHSYALSNVADILDPNFRILNLKSENESVRSLCEALTKIKDEPIEIRFKVGYNKSGLRT